MITLFFAPFLGVGFLLAALAFTTVVVFLEHDEEDQ